MLDIQALKVEHVLDWFGSRCVGPTYRLSIHTENRSPKLEPIVIAANEEYGKLQKS
jgi:hypothetical protein